MMQWLKRWVRNAVLNGGEEVAASSVEAQTPGEFTISCLNAINGTVLQIRTYAPQKGPGPDWKTELYLVAEGENLTDALGRLMLMKNLSR